MIRAALFQCVATALVGFFSYLFWGFAAAQASVFGALVALANTLLLVWRMRASAQGSGRSGGQELARLVRSSVERFLMVALLIAAGLGWLKLVPGALLVGFVLGQLVLVASSIISGIEKR